MKINLNDIVKIKLKPEGVDIYYHKDDKYRERAKELGTEYPIKPEMPIIDKEGYTSMQLWQVMNIFGSSCKIGCDIPMETDILIVESE